MQHQSFIISIVFLLSILALLPVSSCSTDPASHLTDVELQDLYNKAVIDAEVAEPDEISRSLGAIVYYNPDLKWEGDPSESRVLLLTWTGWDGYNNQVGETITLSREIWTSIPAVLGGFYRHNKSLSGDDLILRLEQLYGLPPHNGKQWFVEVWAELDDIFRPSPDPDIADHEAELDFPAWVDEEYRNWFNNLKSESYGENGYPWTRLGYTYDWGNSEDEVGLSEFIIREGSAVKIHSVAATLDYCKSLS